MNGNYSIEPGNIASAQSIRKETRSTTSILAWSIFGVGMLYYCFAYLLRVHPNVMESSLLMHFHITASAYGVLTACYYFAYAPMQLPVGLTIDKFGARRSLLFACTVSIIGVYIFSHTSDLLTAEVGRFLIGFGAAFGYVTTLKLAILWLPKKYFATATGAATATGMTAGVFTLNSFTHLVQTQGYRVALHLILFIGIILLLLIFFIIRDKRQVDNFGHSESVVSFRQLGSYLLVLTKNPQMWIIGIIGTLMYLPASVFIDAWGTAYLTGARGLTQAQAGFAESLMLGGWIIASPIAGYLSDKLETRKLPLILACIGATSVAIIYFYAPSLPITLIYILSASLGILCAPHPLCFTMSKENNSAKISATAIAFANCVIMMGGFLFQPIVGKLLDHGWTGMLTLSGIRTYSVTDYTTALSIIPLGLLCATLLTFLLRETFRSHPEEK